MTGRIQAPCLPPLYFQAVNCYIIHCHLLYLTVHIITSISSAMAASTETRPVFFFDIDNCVSQVTLLETRSVSHIICLVISEEYVLTVYRYWGNRKLNLFIGTKIQNIMSDLIGEQYTPVSSLLSTSINVCCLCLFAVILLLLSNTTPMSSVFPISDIQTPPIRFQRFSFLSVSSETSIRQHLLSITLSIESRLISLAKIYKLFS
jgi:hypothetical protein